VKSKNRYVRSNSKSLGNHVVGPEGEKERLQWEGFAEKEEGETNRQTEGHRTVTQTLSTSSGQRRQPVDT